MWALLFASLLAFQPVSIGPNDAIGFDYLNTDFSNFAIVEFQAQYDNGAWISLGIPPTVQGAPIGWTTYKVLQPFTSGQHTIILRACNVAGCGGGSVPFVFAWPNAVSAVPVNIRRIPK